MSGIDRFDRWQEAWDAQPGYRCALCEGRGYYGELDDDGWFGDALPWRYAVCNRCPAGMLLPSAMRREVASFPVKEAAALRAETERRAA